MKNVYHKTPQGGATILGGGGIVRFGILAIGLAVCLAALTPRAKAMTQLEYLQYMVQVCGDEAKFSAESTPADYLQWARSRNMNLTGGWNPYAQLTTEQLAQSLVQLRGYNSGRFGSDYFRILEREGIRIDLRSSKVTYHTLSALANHFGAQSKIRAGSHRSTTEHHGHHHHDDGDDDDDDDHDGDRDHHDHDGDRDHHDHDGDRDHHDHDGDRDHHDRDHDDRDRDHHDRDHDGDRDHDDRDHDRDHDD